METVSSARCRLCLVNGSKTELMPMGKELRNKAFICVNVKIQCEQECFPYICELCVSKLNNFYNFKKNCSENDFRYKLGKFDENKNNTEVEIVVKEEDAESWQIDEANFEEEQVETKHEIKNEMTEEYCIIEVTPAAPNVPEAKNTKEIFKNFQCEECGHIFTTKAVLKKHIMSHMGIKLHSCDICSKKFTRAEHKHIHLRSHKGIKPYICEICGQTSTKRQDLLRHMLIHSSEKKHECPECGKRFRRTNDVRCHLRTHSDSRPYSCECCGKSYKAGGALRKHYHMHCKMKPKTK